MLPLSAPVALLELPSAPTWARIVATNLLAGLHGLFPTLLVTIRRRRLASADRLQSRDDMIDGIDHIMSNCGKQVVEHRRGFDFVLDERVALSVRAQANAFAHVVD